MEIAERHPLGNSESTQESQWKNQEWQYDGEAKKKSTSQVTRSGFQAVEAVLKSVTKKVYASCISAETGEAPTLFLFFWVHLNFKS